MSLPAATSIFPGSALPEGRGHAVLEYAPRDAFIPFHQRPNRFAAMVCHRRAGKTVACIHELVARAMHTKKKNARFGYVGPLRQQAKEIAWEYLKQATEHIRKGEPRESDLRVTLINGARIQIYGADNPNALRGLYFDGLVIDEYGDCRPSLWGEILLPTLTDRRGWAVFIGTIKGKNHFFKTLERAKADEKWFYMELKGSESGILSEEDLAELRHEMDEEQYRQEIECDPNAAIKGTYYSKIIAQMEQDGRIGSFAYNPGELVYVAADLGFTDSCAWWFWQLDERGPVLIDYYENDSEKLDHYIDMLDSKPYEYSEVWVPHDGTATSFQTGRSTIEQMIDAGLPCRPVPKIAKQHGIDAARKMLKSVRIDRAACEDGIEALRAYRRQFNEKTQQFSNEPLHDWASNGADAFRYFALATADAAMPLEALETPPVELKSPEFTLDDLFADRERDQWRNRIIRL